MSYENPTRAIDTQTGQHLANLQNTISGTFQGIAKSYKAEQDVIAKELKNRELANAKLFEKSQLTEDTLFENTSKTTARYGISQGAGLSKLINETNDLINANNSGKLSLDQVTLNKQRIAAIKASPEIIKRLYTGITQNALALSENKEKNGTYGGLDKFGDPEVYEDLSTWLGTKEGSRELLVETLDNGIDLEVYAVINGRKYSGTQIQRLLGKDSQLVTTVPDPRKDWDNLTNATFLNVDSKTGEPTFKEEMLEAPVTEVTKPDSKGRVFEIVTRKTKKDDLLAAGGADAKASIEAMSPRERAALWNNELAPKDNLGDTKKEELVDISIANTEEFNKKLQKAWTDKWFETKIGDRVEISRTEVKTTKLTPAQRQRDQKVKDQNALDKEVIDQTVKEVFSGGSIILPGNKLDGKEIIKQEINNGILTVMTRAGKDTEEGTPMLPIEYDLKEGKDISKLAMAKFPKNDKKRLDFIKNLKIEANNTVKESNNESPGSPKQKIPFPDVANSELSRAKELIAKYKKYK